MSNNKKNTPEDFFGVIIFFLIDLLELKFISQLRVIISVSLILIGFYFLFISENTKPYLSQVIGTIFYPEDTFKKEVTEVIKKDWSQKMGKECTEVVIVKESEHIYKGFANFVDGSQIKVKVTRDNSQYIYQSVLF